MRRTRCDNPSENLRSLSQNNSRDFLMVKLYTTSLSSKTHEQNCKIMQMIVIKSKLVRHCTNVFVCRTRSNNFDYFRGNDKVDYNL